MSLLAPSSKPWHKEEAAQTLHFARQQLITHLRTAIEKSEVPSTTREERVQIAKARAILAILDSDANKNSALPIPRHPVEEEVVKKRSTWAEVRRIVRLSGALKLKPSEEQVSFGFKIVCCLLGMPEQAKNGRRAGNNARKVKCE